jgi:hypothetical protein
MDIKLVYNSSTKKKKIFQNLASNLLGFIMSQHAVLRTLRRQQSEPQQDEIVCVRQRVSRNGATAPHIFNLGTRRRASGQLHS